MDHFYNGDNFLKEETFESEHKEQLLILGDEIQGSSRERR